MTDRDLIEESIGFDFDDVEAEEVEMAEPEEAEIPEHQVAQSEPNHVRQSAAVSTETAAPGTDH